MATKRLGKLGQFAPRAGPWTEHRIIGCRPDRAKPSLRDPRCSEVAGSGTREAPKGPSSTSFGKPVFPD